MTEHDLMATINDYGIPIPGGKEGILQPLIKNKPVIVFSVLTDDDNKYLTDNVIGVPRPKNWKFTELQFDQSGKIYLIFPITDERLIKLLTNLKALSGTVFLSPAIDHQGTGMVYDCYFVDHCRCEEIKVQDGGVRAIFSYKRIYWTFSDKHFEEGVRYGRYKQQEELDKPK